MSEDNLGPCTLEGHFIRLVPLKMNHEEDLLLAAKDSDFSWMLSDVSNRESMESWLMEVTVNEIEGVTFPFAVQVKSNNQIIGTTRYMDISERHKRVEIGGTWYTKEHWGTVVNPESKYLLMKHAFEDWNANRVQIKTDGNNVHSQRAILKLGATFEGRLRNHMVRRDGTLRDTMMYSILRDEWPSVSENLEKRISSFRDAHEKIDSNNFTNGTVDYRILK
ncbi:MAG: GNAT family protein [Thermoplasmataceae archaeon]